MTGDEFRAARATLGEMWGLGRPLHASEVGRLLRLQGRDVGLTVLRWEKDGPSGPAASAIDLLLDGAVPRDLDTALNRRPDLPRSDDLMNQEERRRFVTTAGAWLCGERWQSELARILTERRGSQLDSATLRRWLSGARSIPDWVVPVLTEELQGKMRAGKRILDPLTA